MNSKGIKALKDTSVCMKCLKEKATHFYRISYRGYGSAFDNENTHWQCCNECHDDKFDLWANETCDEIDCKKVWCEEYKYENDILDFIHSLPLESQELFFNTFSKEGYMSQQDWIDYKLKELPHKKCKKYGVYSHDEINAYEQRFPNCSEVFKEIYHDGSSSCMCFYGASGNSDGSCGINISSQCYMCDNYKPKDGDMKVINELEEYYKDEKARLVHMLNYAKTRLKELDKDVCTYMKRHN